MDATAGHPDLPRLIAAAFDALPYSVAVLDARGTIVAVNKAWRAFGAENGLPDPNALVGGSYFAGIDPDHPEDGVNAQAAADGIRSVLSGAAETFDLEYPCHSPDRRRYLHLRAVAVPGGAVVSHEDVTPRFTAEDELTRHREQIAHMARLSTMGQMVSGLAHEINQPLAAVANYAGACRQLAARGGLAPARLDEALAQIAAEATRAGEIVRRMLAFARRRGVRRTPVDVSSLLREAARFAGSELRHASADLHLDVPPGLPAALVDPVLVQQVVINLIRNAIDAVVAARDPKARRVALTARAADHAFVEVAVTDNGAGVAADMIPRLFDPFFTTKASGLGMGLNLSRSIVEDHGGRLAAARNSDGGMTFSFTLPAAQ